MVAPAVQTPSIFLAYALLIGLAAGSDNGRVAVSLDNPPGTGSVFALLFDSPDTFADLRDPVDTLALSPGESAGMNFEGLPDGSYAVMLFHDINGNGILDRNFIGIPREPLGFSNRYWARGTPSFSGAAVDVREGGTVPVDVELRKIFGRTGMIGVGLGAIMQSSPYVGASSLRVQPIPAITYIGERLQIMGPVAQFGLAHWRAVRLAATAKYRLGAYDEDDSEFLEGMGNRKDSVFCGLALQATLPAGMRMSAGYEYDLLDRVGGGFGRLGIRRGFQLGRFSVIPGIAFNWLSAELAGHEYGVAESEARAGRDIYRPGDAINIEPGLGMSAEWLGSWNLVMNISAEFLAKRLRSSPLVDKSVEYHMFGAMSYTF